MRKTPFVASVSNMGLRDEGPAYNQLSHGTASNSKNSCRHYPEYPLVMLAAAFKNEIPTIEEELLYD
jgi:hypothetical protein